MNKNKNRLKDCLACGSQCCRHVATHIDTPTCKRDYDNIRWYLMHRDVSVFVDHDKDWLLEFTTKCENLGSDGKCTRYEERPMVCSDYPDHDQQCEYETDEPSYTLRFRSAEEFEKWLDKNKRNWRWKKTR